MPSEDSKTSRRQVIGGMATGVAATLAAPAFGQEGGVGQSASYDRDKAELKNPVTEYPHPPFEKQQQEWPGLASKMSPRDVAAALGAVVAPIVA